ncbi:RNA polymerase sigma factor [Methylomonas rosea]|uniref:Sigma-70 family RNA polymerase sigma factor n=1 Tax=Methylomonas rosea TaxID=2952227 RepID=A0ABT1TRB1_9GAMM|nr:sigma-70 family RNA polymerase sigma factor [Methylomonas sp. WSC-7]MCQ8117319.1 sigma-70 family RNA polymerase sigma factor [Methylomonas sp. WSC-7]
MNSITFNIDALFLAHRDSLIHTIFAIVGCPQTAEDLAHEAYLKLLHALESQEVKYPRPFMYQIAKNLALDHLRKEHIRHRADHTLQTDADDDIALLDSLPANTPTPEQQASDQEEVALMLAALEQLTERRRQILVLHKFHHWTYERIASYYGISRSAVEKNVHAALAHLLASQENHPLNRV